MANYIDHIAREIAVRCTDEDTWENPDFRLLFRMYALLCLAKGMDTEVKDVHDAWSAWCAQVDPEHHSLKPFDDLTPEVQDLDRPYHEAIIRVAELEAAVKKGW